MPTATFTEEQAAEFERGFQARLAASAAVFIHPTWMLDFGTSVTEDRRTSLIVDPPDGRMPPLTPEAEEIAARSHVSPVTERMARDPLAEDPDDRGLTARCLVGLNSGPPILPSTYNNNVLLFQTPDHVVIYTEMIHESRIVPLDGRPHLPGQITQWLGDSRGRWEGATLVVETRNFSPMVSFSGNPLSRGARGESFSLVERFTRVDADTVMYEFTVEDPTWWTAAWTAAVPMQATDGPIYEYACHEGNRGLVNVLLGGRAHDGDEPRSSGRE